MGTSGLGALLVEEGLLTEVDRRTIKRTCGTHGSAFARAVIALGLLDEDELAAFLAERTRWRVTGKDLVRESSKEAWGVIDRPLIERLEVLPLKIVGQTLHVAMVDPLDHDTVKQIEFFTGFKVQPHIATFTQIRKGLEKLLKDYKPQTSHLEDLITNHALAASRRLRRIDQSTAKGARPAKKAKRREPEPEPEAEEDFASEDEHGAGGAHAADEVEDSADDLSADLEYPSSVDAAEGTKAGASAGALAADEDDGLLGDGDLGDIPAAAGASSAESEEAALATLADDPAMGDHELDEGGHAVDEERAKTVANLEGLDDLESMGDEELSGGDGLGGLDDLAGFDDDEPEALATGKKTADPVDELLGLTDDAGPDGLEMAADDGDGADGLEMAADGGESQDDLFGGDAAGGGAPAASAAALDDLLGIDEDEPVAAVAKADAPTVAAPVAAVAQAATAKIAVAKAAAPAPLSALAGDASPGDSLLGDDFGLDDELGGPAGALFVDDAAKAMPGEGGEDLFGDAAAPAADGEDLFGEGAENPAETAADGEDLFGEGAATPAETAADGEDLFGEGAETPAATAADDEDLFGEGADAATVAGPTEDLFGETLPALPEIAAASAAAADERFGESSDSPAVADANENLFGDPLPDLPGAAALATSQRGPGVDPFGDASGDDADADLLADLGGAVPAKASAPAPAPRRPHLKVVESAEAAALFGDDDGLSALDARDEPLIPATLVAEAADELLGFDAEPAAPQKDPLFADEFLDDGLMNLTDAGLGADILAVKTSAPDALDDDLDSLAESLTDELAPPGGSVGLEELEALETSDEDDDAAAASPPSAPAAPAEAGALVASLNRALFTLTLAKDFADAVRRAAPALARAGVECALLLGQEGKQAKPLLAWETPAPNAAPEVADQNLYRFAPQALIAGLGRYGEAWQPAFDAARAADFKSLSAWSAAGRKLMALSQPGPAGKRLVVVAAWDPALADVAAVQLATAAVFRRLAQLLPG